MTPRHLHALRKRQEQKMQREELLVGIIASSTVNYSWCHPDRRVTAESFMLHPFPEESTDSLEGADLIRRAFAPIIARQKMKAEVEEGRRFA